MVEPMFTDEVRLREMCRTQAERLATLTAANARLRDALKPFADERQEWIGVIDRAPGCSLMVGFMHRSIEQAHAALHPAPECAQEVRDE